MKLVAWLALTIQANRDRCAVTRPQRPSRHFQPRYPTPIVLHHDCCANLDLAHPAAQRLQVQAPSLRPGSLSPRDRGSRPRWRSPWLPWEFARSMRRQREPVRPSARPRPGSSPWWFDQTAGSDRAWAAWRDTEPEIMVIAPMRMDRAALQAVKKGSDQ